MQRLQRRRRHGVEEAAQVVQLHRLPEEAAADIERVDGGAAPQRLAEEDGAVEAAADEDGQTGRIGGDGERRCHFVIIVGRTAAPLANPAGGGASARARAGRRPMEDA